MPYLAADVGRVRHQKERYDRRNKNGWNAPTSEPLDQTCLPQPKPGDEAGDFHKYESDECRGLMLADLFLRYAFGICKVALGSVSTDVSWNCERSQQKQNDQACMLEFVTLSDDCEKQKTERNSE